MANSASLAVVWRNKKRHLTRSHLPSTKPWPTSVSLDMGDTSGLLYQHLRMKTSETYRCNNLVLSKEFWTSPNECVWKKKNTSPRVLNRYPMLVNCHPFYTRHDDIVVKSCLWYFLMTPRKQINNLSIYQTYIYLPLTCNCTPNASVPAHPGRSLFNEFNTYLYHYPHPRRLPYPFHPNY